MGETPKTALHRLYSKLYEFFDCKFSIKGTEEAILLLFLDCDSLGISTWTKINFTS
ncbi:MAG: hypothetical protein F6K65_26300 [Moorea sp. SIO3C2]|nr:hypothetical protein [Moorena sp. SIO3C2]